MRKSDLVPTSDFISPISLLFYSYLSCLRIAIIPWSCWGLPSLGLRDGVPTASMVLFSRLENPSDQASSEYLNRTLPTINKLAVPFASSLSPSPFLFTRCSRQCSQSTLLRVMQPCLPHQSMSNWRAWNAPPCLQDRSKRSKGKWTNEFLHQWTHRGSSQFINGMSQRRSEETVNKYTKELVFCFVLPLAEEGGEPTKWFKQV